MPRLDARIAVLATDGFEQSELTEPVDALRRAGATVHVIAPEQGAIRGWNRADWGDEVIVDVPLDRADPGDYDALVLPGGVMNPDKLRTNQDAVKFARAMFQEGKPVSAICHGPQLLIECEALAGRELTSYPSIRTDLENAGARWVDRQVVVDHGLITSRNPGDLPAFIARTIEQIHESVHADHGTR